jgi:ribosome-associated protein
MTPRMEALPVDSSITIPAWELWFTASRSSGAGGQHVNTTSSRVSLCWVPASSSVLDDAQKDRVIRRLAPRINAEGVLMVHVEDYRSQLRNLEVARERLAALVAQALFRPPRRVATRVPYGATQRRLDEKSHHGAIKKARRSGGSDTE